MPAGPHPLRIALALAALLLTIALPAQAQDPPAPEAVVAVVRADGSEGGRSLEIPWSQLVGDADVLNVAYDDPSGERRYVTGVSLGLIFRRLGIADGTWSGLSVDRAGAEAMTISRRQVLTYGPAVGYVFMDRDGSLKLVRQTTTFPPVTSDVAAAIDGRVTIRRDWEASVTASLEQVLVGRAVSFAATVPPGVDPSHVEYEWDFNDERSLVRTDRPFATRRFGVRRDYDVLVSFYVDGVLWGEDLPPSVRVTAVDPHGDDELPPEEGSGNRSGDRARGRRRRPRADQSTGEDQQDAAPPPALDEPDHGDGSTPTAGYVTPAPAATPAPSMPATPPPSAPRPRRRPKPASRRAAARAQPRSATIDGYLLASAGAPLPAPATPQTDDSRALPVDEDEPRDVPPLVWVGAGLLALVVLGWGLESRTTLPYFKP